MNKDSPPGAAVAPAPSGPAVVIFAVEARVADRARRRLPLDAVAIPLTDWSLFVTVAARAECAVLCVPSRPTETFVSQAERLRATYPYLPIVALVPSHFPVEEASRVPATVVLKERGEARALAQAVEAACSQMLLEHAAAVLRELPDVPDPLRRAVELAISRTPPPRSVLELAAATGHHRHTLGRYWRRRVDPAPVQLSDLIDWLLLVRASIAHARGKTWTDAAEELGIHRQTIAQLAERHLGERLPDFSAQTYARVRSTFERQVLAPLLSRSLD